MELTEPTTLYRDSYRSYVDEFKEKNEELVPFCIEFDNEPFEAFLERLRNLSNGIGVPEGFVAHSTFWLVDDENVVAVSNLRHQLTKSLKREGGHIGYSVRPSMRKRGYGRIVLERTLKMAGKIGIQDVLITCDRENTGSIGVILANGGVFDSDEYLPERNSVINRYWISI